MLPLQARSADDVRGSEMPLFDCAGTLILSYVCSRNEICIFDYWLPSIVQRIVLLIIHCPPVAGFLKVEGYAIGIHGIPTRY